MSEQKWPERGQMSTDGRYYTRFDGQVVEFPVADCDGATQTQEVEGAYVPSSDERIAEKEIREAIEDCNDRANDKGVFGCRGCDWSRGRCALRRYLANVIRDPKAWEVAE